MKQLILNKKIKNQLAVHFSNGGTIHNVPESISRVSLEDRQTCYGFHLKKRETQIFNESKKL